MLVKNCISLAREDPSKPTSVADASSPLSAKKATLVLFRFCIRDLHNEMAFASPLLENLKGKHICVFLELD
jgi:hypothetical protein